jgi:hypothetical protein
MIGPQRRFDGLYAKLAPARPSPGATTSAALLPQGSRSTYTPGHDPRVGLSHGIETIPAPMSSQTMTSISDGASWVRGVAVVV